ncbi:MAG: flavodoxin family protein [Lachnospiraceae bacterium]
MKVGAIMKILFLNASPRAKSYTAAAMRLIKENISSEHTVEWVDINSLNIKPCVSCLKCRPNSECILPPDDGHRIAKMIYNADALIMGSPTYFGNITGPLKTLIDRSLTAFEEIAANGLEMPVPIHKGHKAALITACNIPAPMSSLPTQGAGALSAMQVAITAGGYDLVGSIIIDGAAALKEIPEDIRGQAKIIAYTLTN